MRIDDLIVTVHARGGTLFVLQRTISSRSRGRSCCFETTLVDSYCSSGSNKRSKAGPRSDQRDETKRPGEKTRPRESRAGWLTFSFCLFSNERLDLIKV